MPYALVTGEEKNWDCVPFEQFKEHLPFISDFIEDFMHFGLEGHDLASNTLYNWLANNLFHIQKPELWLHHVGNLIEPSSDLFIYNIRHYADRDALKLAKRFSVYNEVEDSETLALIAKEAIRYRKYPAAQIALNAWRQANFENKKWTMEYADIVFESAIEGHDYTGVLPAPGLRQFLENNQADAIHCIQQNRNGFHHLKSAPLGFLKALKGAGMDNLFREYGEYNFVANRYPDIGDYLSLDELGIHMSRSDLLGKMGYAGTSNQWLEALRLLLSRGELIDLHEAYKPVLTSANKQKPSSSVPGVSIQMPRFIDLMKEMCAKGESVKTAALHYVGELIQTDERMPHRLIEAGIPPDFLQIERVREVNFMIDLGL